MKIQIINDIIAAIEARDKKTKPYDTTATVVREEGSTLWVHIPGGVDETPVRKTINADIGDTVHVRVSGGSAWITGNSTAPPTDDTAAEHADQRATQADKKAVKAQETAESASKTSTNYVTDIDNGILVHPEGDETTGWKIADVLELLNAGISCIKAWTENNKSMLRVGKEAGGHTQIEDGTLALIAPGSGFEAAELYAGNRVLNWSIDPNAYAPSGWLSDLSVCTPLEITFEAGEDSYHNTSVIKIANGDLGLMVTAYAIQIGNGASADLNNVAIGEDTAATAENQVVIGKNNATDANAAFIIGNGSSSRSNALTVDWNGNLTAAGEIEDGSGNQLSDKLDKTFDTATGTVNSSITVSRATCRLLKIGNVVFITVAMGNITSSVNTNTNLFTIPAAYRPSSNVSLQGTINASVGNFTVRSDGYVRQTLVSSLSNCFCTGFYTI
ncbi:MAG: hypothetical protein IJ821_07300 [Lachnospiraceae bacterium]|nr:hypothetical protein [Lachnospiraceae bacterium]